MTVTLLNLKNLLNILIKLYVVILNSFNKLSKKNFYEKM